MNTMGPMGTRTMAHLGSRHVGEAKNGATAKIPFVFEKKQNPAGTPRSAKT